MLWRELPISKKMKFFNVWFFISSISNICNIIGSFLSIEYDLVGSNVTKARLLLNGIGCMMAWVTMVQYFEHSSSYYVLILTLKRGTPRVVRFVLGVLPVFLGYAIFGVAYFSSSSASFASLDSASVTLFCLLNGDVIHDVFDELYPVRLITSFLSNRMYSYEN